MEEFLVQSLSAATKGELVDLFETEMADFGVRYYAYHVIARDFRKQDLLSSLRCHRVPSGWLERYIEKDYVRIDPIQLAAAQRSLPFYWDEISATDGLIEAQSEFFISLRDAGFGAGISVPVFARPGTFAYFCFGSGRESFSLSQVDIVRVQMICYLMHARFDQLIGERPCPKLSKRETEVLTLLAAGRSNPEIARQLEISHHTVDTLVKRCFIKLDAKSRLEAGLLAAARGLAMIASPCLHEASRACSCSLHDCETSSCGLAPGHMQSAPPPPHRSENRRIGVGDQPHNPRAARK